MWCVTLIPHTLQCDWSQLHPSNQRCYRVFDCSWLQIFVNELTRILCKPFGMSKRHVQGKVALTLYIWCVRFQVCQDVNTYFTTWAILKATHIFIIIIGSCNTWHIHSMECSRSHCGMPQHSNRWLADTPSHWGTRIKGQNIWEGVRFLVCRRKPECPEKTYQGGYGIGKPNLRTPTHLATGLCESWYLLDTI